MAGTADATGLTDRSGGSALHAAPLAAHAVAAAGALLARSFAADPFPCWMLPDEGERARVLPWHYGTLVRVGLLAGEVWSVDEPLAGVAVWLRRGDQPLGFDQLERAGVLDAPRVFGSAAFARYSRVVTQLERLRKRDVPGPHWYLAAIGADPDRQGSGIGSALVATMLATAAAEGLPSYLESFQPRNHSFYERLGFETLFDGVEPASGLRVRTFVREAHASGEAPTARPSREREAPW